MDVSGFGGDHVNGGGVAVGRYGVGAEVEYDGEDGVGNDEVGNGGVDVDSGALGDIRGHEDDVNEHGVNDDVE